MNFEIYKGKKTYYVYKSGKWQHVSKEVARLRKCKPYDLICITVWIKDDELFLEKVKGAKQMLAAVMK